MIMNQMIIFIVGAQLYIPHIIVFAMRNIFLVGDNEPLSIMKYVYSSRGDKYGVYTIYIIILYL